ncbi:MAG: hypothetical protein KF861_08310 [Planctomycetaceae bacterium]|nr:hypothetical protein [Planctomycetaceae bacterium]
MPFPIHRIERNSAQLVEALGSKPKFWFRRDNQRCLFKAEDRGTGEDWAEVIACHLCRLLGLPHVEYELAIEVDGETLLRPGVICANMSPFPKALILGNQLLLTLDASYPHAQRFKVKQHTVDGVCEILGLLEPPQLEWMSDVPPGIATAIDVFIGYVLLDTWIANQDRHHENWGAIWSGEEGSVPSLAPSFDHGAGLARNLLDSERKTRLTTKDRNRSLAKFVAKGRSAFYSSPSSSKPLLLLDAFHQFAARRPLAAEIWIDRLRSVVCDSVSDILDQVPSERMSSIGRQFTFELLELNRQRLLNWEDSP